MSRTSGQGVRRIGVAGASGSVGSAIVQQLVADGFAVVALVRNGMGAALLEATIPGCEIRVGGTGRAADGSHALDDCDVIVNCALAGSGGLPKEAYRRNRAIVDGLLAAHDLRWLVHFSTVAIYGEMIRPATDERSAFESPRPESEYGRSKLDVERHAVRAAAARGVKCTALRLGHVVGPGIYRSREIIELARDPRTRLPFDGSEVSNCIHIDTLARSISALVTADGPEGVRSFIEPAWTWRDVFAFHAEAVGASVPAGMDARASSAVREAHVAQSVTGDVKRWVRALPVKQLVRSPKVFDLALRTLVVAPDWLTQRVSQLNKRVGARSAGAAASVGGAPELPPLYYSARVPGPYLELASPPATGAGSVVERTRSLGAWYAGLSVPRLPGEASRIESLRTGDASAQLPEFAEA